MSGKHWYYHENPNGTYFTHSARSKKNPMMLGDGSERPTPKQIMDAIKDNPDLEMDYSGNLLVEYDAVDTVHAPVELPGGFYRHEPRSPYDNTPERLEPTEVRSDTVLTLSETFAPVIEDITTFLDPESYKIDRELGIQHRKGILLYGPPGTGKTTMIRSILKDIVPKDAIVVFMETLFSNKMIDNFRKNEDDRLKVLVFEEMITAVESIKMDRLLDFLDGEKSLNNTLIIGTTNYPEKLPGNIVDRPGRFDSLYKIGDPNKSIRRQLLDFYLSREATTEEVDMTQGLSTAAIKELCLVMRRRKWDMDQSIKSIKKHRELVKKEFAESRPIGMGRSNDDWDE